MTSLILNKENNRVSYLEDVAYNKKLIKANEKSSDFLGDLQYL